MAQTTVYRPGIGKTFLLIVPQALVLVLCVAFAPSALRPKADQLAGLAICALFAIACIAMIGYGIAAILQVRLEFSDVGIRYQNLGISPMLIPWKQLVGVSIQDTSDGDTSKFRAVLRLRDSRAFVEALPATTQKRILAQSGLIDEGIPIRTDLISITKTQFVDEIKARCDVPIVLPGSLSPFSESAPLAVSVPVGHPIPAKTSAPVDTSTQDFRPGLPKYASFIGVLGALIAVGIFMLLSHDAKPARETTFHVYGVLIIALSLVAGAVGFAGLSKTRLHLSMDGILYSDANISEVRIRWEDVAGVHVHEAPKSGNLSLMIDLHDFEGYLSTLDPQLRRKLEMRRAVIGDGIPISARTLGSSPEEMSRIILHRAGLK